MRWFGIALVIVLGVFAMRSLWCAYESVAIGDRRPARAMGHLVWVALCVGLIIALVSLA